MYETSRARLRYVACASPMYVSTCCQVRYCMTAHQTYSFFFRRQSRLHSSSQNETKDITCICLKSKIDRAGRNSFPVYCTNRSKNARRHAHAHCLLQDQMQSTICAIPFQFAQPNSVLTALTVPPTVPKTLGCVRMFTA